MLLGMVNLVMHLFLSDNVVAKSCVRSFSAVGGTVFTVSVVFGPKVYEVKYQRLQNCHNELLNSLYDVLITTAYALHMPQCEKKV